MGIEFLGIFDHIFSIELISAFFIFDCPQVHIGYANGYSQKAKHFQGCHTNVDED